MVIEESSIPIRDNRKVFWVVTTLLFLVALALRWISLDLMTFRFDQAAVAFRAMETFRSGLPLTGIINSQGFHNGPGYIWTLLPAFLVSPDPRLATALHGLLTASMVYPLAILGRRHRDDALLWLPVVIAAVLPASVFAGRNLWAQYLLPPFICWALLALDWVSNSTLSWPSRRRSASAALALLAWATSIHFSAGLLLIIAAGWVVVTFKRRVRDVAIAAIPALLICVTIIPSFMDWVNVKVNPREVPDYAAEYEAILPDPLPWYARVPDSVAYSFGNSSIEALWGVQTFLSPLVRTLVNVFDVLVLLLIAAGGLFALIKLFRKPGPPLLIDRQRQFATLLAAWLLVPAVAGGLLVERVNAGYFLGSLPAGWLLVLLLPRGKASLRMVWISVPFLVLVCGFAISGLFLSVIARQDFLPGSYYVTYRKQVEVVSYLADSGISAKRVTHLSGDWFGHSYAYIHKHVMAPAPAKVSASGNQFALIEDKKVRPDQPERLKVFWALEPVEVGGVGLKLMPSRGAAETFTWNYYELPAR